MFTFASFLFDSRSGTTNLPKHHEVMDLFNSNRKGGLVF